MEPKIDLVVARYNEYLGWINNIDDHFNVIIYNKGKPLTACNFKRPVVIINVPNVGRESETYLRHIIKNYDDSLADYTIFCQGEPFAHANNFERVLKNIKEFIKTFPDYHMVPFTNGWILDKNMPPKDIYERVKITLPMSLEDIFIDTQSTRTLQPQYYYDTGIYTVYNEYMQYHKLPPGVNIMHHYLSQAGAGHIIPEHVDLFPIFYAALFMVKREQIQKNDLSVYERMWQLNCENSLYGFLTERVWLLLFDGFNKLEKLKIARDSVIKYPLPIDKNNIEMIELHHNDFVNQNIKKSVLSKYLPGKFQ